ncbi:MAG: hypothetical protein RIQ89_573 [Bacteroidota bacterium]|jgi:MerR family transcriptional regulator, light-induced transcriptional regulator
MSQFSIRDIERLTGIKAHTLRIWEQRYNLPKPKRTDTNIRFYDDEDLKLLLNISMLNRYGHKISDITRFSRTEMLEKVANYAKEETLQRQDQQQDLQIQALIFAMLNLDERSFERTLGQSILKMGLEKTIVNVLFPFLRTVGQLWQSGSINPAYEHFMTNLIRMKILVAIDSIDVEPATNPKKFILFLPQGESHEIGLLYAHYIIKSKGHNVLYLGQNLPFDDLEKVYEKFPADYIFTSITMPPSNYNINSLIENLLNHFQKSFLVITGNYIIHHLKKLPSRVMKLEKEEDLLNLL